MANTALLQIKVVADATQAALGMDKAAGSSSRFARGMQKAMLPAAAVGGALLLVGKKAIDAASDLQQSQGAVEAVFGKQSKAVQAYAKTAAKSMGLSAAAYNNYAALVGGALQNAGFSTSQAVTESNKVMQRAADLAATYGGSTADAVEAINAAVARGEYDPLERLNVSLNATSVNAILAARGQDKLTGAALQHAKAQVVLEQVYAKSAKTAGQYAREQDTAAGSAQTAQAQWTNAAAALGTSLLPAVTMVSSAFGKLATVLQGHSKAVQIVVAVLGTLVIAVFAINAALKLYQAGLLVTAAIQKATWLASPIGLVIAAVLLLVAGIVLLWKHSATFRKIVTAVWAGIKTGATAAARVVVAVFRGAWTVVSAAARVVLGVVRGVFNGISTAVSWVVSKVKALAAWFRSLKVPSAIKAALDAIKAAAGHVATALSNVKSWLGKLSVPGGIKDALNGIKSAAEGVIGAVKSLIGWLSKIKVPHISLPHVGGKSASKSVAASPTVTGLAGQRVAGAPRPMASASGASVVINVNGALDPEGVARQIRRILDGHDRRVASANRGLRGAPA